MFKKNPCLKKSEKITFSGQIWDIRPIPSKSQILNISEHNIFLVLDKMHVTRVLIFLYTVLRLITPRQLDLVSFIMETIATIAANFAHGLMIIVIAMAVLGNKEYLIAIMGNCFPQHLQVK